MLLFKHTAYFDHMRTRPDRAMIRDEWIVYVIRYPVHEAR